MKKLMILLALSLAHTSWSQDINYSSEDSKEIMTPLETKGSYELKADRLFENYNFQDAVRFYQKADRLTTEGKRNLAESFRQSGDYLACQEVYSELMQTEYVTADDIFNYTNVLRINGKYEDSDRVMREMLAKYPKDVRAINYVNGYHELPKLLIDQGQFDIRHLSINSSNQDFGVALYGNKRAVFASGRGNSQVIKRHYNWNDQNFLDMYIADVVNLELENPELLPKSINQKMHEGVASFAKGGRLMAYTKNNYEGYDDDGVIKLQLYFIERSNEGEWGEEISFPLNHDDYSVGHPTLTNDGKTMYFASDMPGGFGGVDIYVIRKNKDGRWGNAKNLGPEINTSADEMFPFYQEDKRLLFFSSEGHFGIGGLDVFVAPEVGESNYSKIQNLGFPINSKWDDFAFVIDNQMNNGYFSSNREGGYGDDDIYGFRLLEQFDFGKILKGTAFDTEGNILSETKVFLSNKDSVLIGSMITKEDGKYEFKVEANQDFNLLGKKLAYYDGTNVAHSRTKEEVIVADLILAVDPKISLYLVVTDRKTGDTIPEVNLTLTDNISGSTEEVTTSSIGEYRKPLPHKRLKDRGSYNFTLQKDGYFTRTVTFNVEFDNPGEYPVHAILDFTMDAEVDELSEMIVINPIFFDYDKFNIRSDAAIELDKIIEVMNRYPDMVVELGSHTDCRGTKKYNERLSQKRANSSVSYIRNGIDKPHRIYGVGYGENKLLNNCYCEGKVKNTCPEDLHQLNRRTEFRIISTGGEDLDINNTSPNSFD